MEVQSEVWECSGGTEKVEDGALAMTRVAFHWSSGPWAGSGSGLGGVTGAGWGSGSEARSPAAAAP